MNELTYLAHVRCDLLVALADIDFGRLLEHWRWLIPESSRPLFATALGDLFVIDPGGQVSWLDMGDGQLQPVATSEADFERAASDPDNASFWFGTTLVDQLLAAGKALGPGECYSYLQLPMMGSQYEPNNFGVCDVVSHFRIWGPIHEQLRNLPDGATVEFKVVD